MGARKLAFKPFSEFTLKAVKEHNTKECFHGNKYWRDENLDKQTPQIRKAHEGGEYKAESLTESANYREMSMDILGINGDSWELAKAFGPFSEEFDKDLMLSLKELDKDLQYRLKKEGHTVEMKQIENEIQRFGAGAGDTALAKDKSVIWFLDNYDNTVSVASVGWYSISYGGKWVVNINQFDDIYRMTPDGRLMPGNRVVSRKQAA